MTTLANLNSWIFAARPDPRTRLRLFCFPHAGGGASMFRPWLGALPPEIEVCPMQLPGRENRLRELLYQQFSQLVEAMAEALRPYFTLPFAFFGHSMGALLSFGLARHLRRQNEALPVHLFLSAYRAPQIPNLESPLHLLPEAAFVKKLLSFNGTNPEVLANEELRKFLLPIMRADFAVCETFHYTPEEPLACPITVFGGLQDNRVQQEALLAWREQTSSAFAQRMLPGGHFYFQQQQTRLQLLQAIAQDLARHTQ
jgi:medium-chain acyl-[acyl-carrier-protein] hydrolase